MKSKNLPIIVISIALLLLLGAAGYMMLGKTNVSTKTTNKEIVQKTTVQQTAKSLLDLIKMGQNLRCNFRSEIKNGSNEGTVYVSGKKVRGDFVVMVGNKKMQTSTIVSDETTYVWGTEMPNQGIKITISLDKISDNQQTSQYIDPNQKINYDCKPWNVDQSLFTPPADIKFTDMTNLLLPKADVTKPQVQTGTTSNPCSTIEDETARTACESALKKAVSN